MKAIVRIVLGICLIGAMALIFLGIAAPRVVTSDGASVIVGSLAVIAATVSSRTASRVIERDEESRRPSVVAYLDFSRYGLVQLSVTNPGQTAALNVRFDWVTEPCHEGGEPVLQSDETLAILMPGERVLRNLGRGNALFAEGHTRFKGSVSYHDAAGHMYNNSVLIDFTKYAKSLDFTDEKLKAEYEMQKVPKAITSLTAAIHSLSLSISSMDTAETPKEPEW